MGLPVGVERKISFKSAGATSAVGRSGLLASFLTSEVSTPEIDSSYETFTSPEKEAAAITSVYSTVVA